MITVDSRPIVGEYVFLSKYSQTRNGFKETWHQAVNRVMDMHVKYYRNRVSEQDMPEFLSYFGKAYDLYHDRRILGAQRALQYGGELMTEKVARFYNCTMTHCDRVRFFEEAMYLLLCGCGVGYSVQHRHTEKLPVPKGFDKDVEPEVFQAPDTIEGWAACVGKLMTNYYEGGAEVEFDLSLIRPKGAPIRGGFRAPGPEPLRAALQKIRGFIGRIKNRKLTPFELHYVTCIFADSVVTGGVRRSAMIALFDAWDMEMAQCKTGNWISEKKELCRANNSAVILPGTDKETFDTIFEFTKKYGEPGFVFLDNPDFAVNPCGEVTTLPIFEDETGRHTGWGFCNLAEINGGKVKTKEEFYEACEAAAVICTLQAGYTNFKVLERWSQKIAERDALIGVGITGFCEHPDILFDPEVQRTGARIVKKTNKAVAKLIGINPAARCTVVKPSGNSSQLLGTPSGISLGHSYHYIRHIQAADTEQALHEWEKINPECVEVSAWNPDREKVLAFPVTLPENALVRENVTAIEFLQYVLLTKNNWIEEGTNFAHPESVKYPKLRMNVSNTCTVKEDEWDGVREFLWSNRDQFGGVSLLSYYGDLDYPQAPYTQVLDENQLAARYGAGAILSSGLVVDSKDIFRDVWEACNAAMGFAPNLLQLTDKEISDFITKHIQDGKFLVKIDGVCFSDVNCVIDHLRHKVEQRLDWVRRFNSFAEKYMGGDRQLTSYCLKHVNAYHKWQHICRMRKVDYNGIIWEEVTKEAGSEIATACAGGSCVLQEYHLPEK